MVGSAKHALKEGRANARRKVCQMRKTGGNVRDVGCGWYVLEPWNDFVAPQGPAGERDVVLFKPYFKLRYQLVNYVSRDNVNKKNRSEGLPKPYPGRGQPEGQCRFPQGPVKPSVGDPFGSGFSMGPPPSVTLAHTTFRMRSDRTTRCRLTSNTFFSKST